ncbi:hypothetical protein [Vibrio cionasavignyae]|uniref:hypothetical protein n=1 Tax=Vibrio cionasavignyae TaxID=2910252 RepID=UPI003D14D568
MIRLLTIMIVLCTHTVLNTVKAAGSELIEQVEREKSQAHWSGLPIWGEQVREMGYELPIPVGFGVYMNSQDVEYIATDDFKIDATGGVLGGFGKPAHYVVPADDVAIKGTDKSVQLRADAWVFPFLNIYGLAGYTEGNKEISADLSNATRNGKPFGVPATIPINIEYQAYNLGIGAVIATQIDVIEGINPIIITAAGAVTNAWTTTTDSTILTKIGSLRVGQRYDVPYGKLALLLGYQYQSIEQNVTGSLTNLQVGGINLADELQFDVDLKSKETSNMSLAAVYDFGYEKEWNLMAEYSFLNWNQLILAVGYRF